MNRAGSHFRATLTFINGTHCGFHSFFWESMWDITQGIWIPDSRVTNTSYGQTGSPVCCACDQVDCVLNPWLNWDLKKKKKKMWTNNFSSPDFRFLEGSEKYMQPALRGHELAEDFLVKLQVKPHTWVLMTWHQRPNCIGTGFKRNHMISYRWDLPFLSTGLLPHGGTCPSQKGIDWLWGPLLMMEERWFYIFNVWYNSSHTYYQYKCDCPV